MEMTMTMFVVGLGPEDKITALPNVDDVKNVEFQNHLEYLREQVPKLIGQPSEHTMLVPYPAFGGANWNYEFRTGSSGISLWLTQLTNMMRWNLGRMVQCALSVPGVDHVAIEYNGKYRCKITLVIPNVRNDTVTILNFEHIKSNQSN